jgi:hypothetical protein
MKEKQGYMNRGNARIPGGLPDFKERSCSRLLRGLLNLFFDNSRFRTWFFDNLPAF